MTESSDAADQTTEFQSRLFWEDVAGKVILLAIFLWQLSDATVKLAAIVMRPQPGFMWIVVLVAQVSALAFLGLIVWLTLRRRPALDAAEGLEARVSAFMGTFLMLGLSLVPRAPIGETQMLLAAILIVIGTVSSIWCIWWLGRAFSVMATARELRVSGPYAHVRHPLYATEAIAVIGLVLLNGSLLGVLVGALQFFFQYRRILNEERVLARAFPDYDSYRARTPMLVPLSFPR